MEEHNDGIEMSDHTEDLDPVEIKKEQIKQTLKT